MLLNVKPSLQVQISTFKKKKKNLQENQRLKVCCNSNYQKYIGYSKYFKKDKQLKIYIAIKTFQIDNLRTAIQETMNSEKVYKWHI